MIQIKKLEEQWPQIQMGLKNSDFEFELPEDCVQEIVNSFNIKIQKCSVGHICYRGHHVGLGQNGKSSGSAFCKFLKQQGFDDSSTLKEIIEKYFS